MGRLLFLLLLIPSLALADSIGAWSVGAGKVGAWDVSANRVGAWVVETAGVVYHSADSGTKILNTVPGIGNELLINVNVGQGSNNFVIAGISWIPSVNNDVMTGTGIISSVVINGTGGGNLTYIGSAFVARISIETYYYVGAQTGNRIITVTFDDSDSPGGNCEITSGGTAVSFTGVNQITPIIQSASTTGINSPITNTLAVVADNALVDFTASSLSTTITVTGTNQIAVGNQQYGGLGSVIRQGASTKTILSTGNETMSWNEGTTTRDWAQYTSEIGVP